MNKIFDYPLFEDHYVPGSSSLDLNLGSKPDMENPWAVPASEWVDYFKQASCGGFLMSSQFFRAREIRISHVGFPILTQETLTSLVSICQGRSVLDVGARTGFITRNLQKAGIDCLGLDLVETVIDDQLVVEAGDFREFDREITLLSWPPYLEELAFQAATNMASGKTLIYQGEDLGGCTGDETFFEELEKNFILNNESTDALNEFHVTWPGIHDRWFVYVKR